MVSVPTPDREAAPTLGEHLRRAAEGRFPPVDGGFTVLGPEPSGVEAVVCFTGHAVLATRLGRQELAAAGVDGFGGATLPRVIELLAGPGGELDVLDVLLASRGTGHGSVPERNLPEPSLPEPSLPEPSLPEPSLPERPDWAEHPRVRHARHWRTDVRVYGDERGLVTLGRGVGGLPQLSFEVPPEQRGRGFGRALLTEALGLVEAGEPVLVSVAPGNAASLRAVLAVGFVPLGSVQLLRPTR